MGEQVRIGVLCNHFLWEEWEIQVMEQLLRIPGTEFTVVIYPAGKKEAPNFFSIQKFLDYPYRRLLWNKLRGFWFRSALFSKQDYRSRLGLAHELEVRVQRETKNRERIDSEGVASIAALKPDLIIRFGFNILQGEILTLPRLGVWSFHHADPFEIRGGPLGFWEIYFGFRSCAVVLQRLNETLDKGEVLAYRRFTTSLHSYQEHAERLIGNSIEMPALVLKGIIRKYWTAPVFEPLPKQVSRLYRIPGNLKVIVFFIRLFFRRLEFYYNKLFRQEHWTVYLYDGVTGQTKQIPDPRIDGYFADPFFYRDKDGTLHILVENYVRKHGKGEIAIIHLEPEISIHQLFDSVIHRSYPFIVTTPNQDYVVPEQAVAGSVFLRPFNGDADTLSSWEMILSFPGVDSTLVYFQGRWWLWCTRAGIEADSALYLFYSDNVKGPYLPHAGNPVKFDCASSRPAGRPIVLGGKLYRPAQDCSHTYGGNVVWNCVEVLDPNVYSERPAPSPQGFPVKGKAAGMHHIDYFESSFVYDIKSYRFSFISFVNHLKARII